MQPGQLYEPPFTRLNDHGLDGMFSNDNADKIVAILQTISSNADATEKAA